MIVDSKSYSFFFHLIVLIFHSMCFAFFHLFLSRSLSRFIVVCLSPCDGWALIIVCWGNWFVLFNDIKDWECIAYRLCVRVVPSHFDWGAKILRWFIFSLNTENIDLVRFWLDLMGSFSSPFSYLFRFSGQSRAQMTILQRPRQHLSMFIYRFPSIYHIRAWSFRKKKRRRKKKSRNTESTMTK